jgi:phosphate transport system permease protein
MSANAVAPAEKSIHDTLTGARLPNWGVPAVGVGAVALAVLLNLTTGVAGVAGTLVVAVLLFLVGQTAWSFAVEGRRHAVDRLATTGIYATFLIALAPLISVLWTVIEKGTKVLSPSFLTNNMRNIGPNDLGGGVYHAIIGTIEQVLIASLIAVPLGVLAAIYLVEYGKGKLASAISFFVDVMTGVPSIVAGLFIYTLWVLTLGANRSGFAASLALTILMMPVVIRTTEEMLKIVPNDLREASYALGVPKWKTIVRIVLPTALAGIVTGVMLAIARVSGETAPLLLATSYIAGTQFNPFAKGQAALPTFIWDQQSRGTDAALDRAWAGVFVLIFLVMVVYISARLIARAFAPKAS